MGKKSYDDLNELEKLRWDFWNTLRQHVKESASFLQPSNTKDGHWLNFPLGVIDETPSTNQFVTIVWCQNQQENGIVDCSRYHVQATFDSLTRNPDNQALSRHWLGFMRERERTLHDQLGFELEWDDHLQIEIRLRSRCVIADIRNLDAWPGYINDMRIQAEHLHNVFQQHALAFNKAHLHG